jgi:hypothetical protein
MCVSPKKTDETSERFENPRDGDVELTNRLLTFRLGLIGIPNRTAGNDSGASQ